MPAIAITLCSSVLKLIALRQVIYKMNVFWLGKLLMFEVTHTHAHVLYVYMYLYTVCTYISPWGSKN